MSSINDTLMNLSNNEYDDADVTFVVHGQEVKALKCIISNRSEMLKAMINSDLAPADGRHLINDEKITIEDFKNFIKFLYLDKCDIDLSNIGALLHMSEMYLVPLLKEKCLEFVKQKCQTMDGVFECCDLGILYDNECPDMLRLCFTELSQNWPKSLYFVNNQNLTLVTPELLERIVKDCPRTSSFTEDFLLARVLEWGKRRCQQQNIEPDLEGFKSVLSPITQQMKLENVSIRSWIFIILPNGLAPQEDCYKILVGFAKACPSTSHMVSAHVCSTFLDLTPKNVEDGGVPLQQTNYSSWLRPSQSRDGSVVNRRSQNEHFTPPRRGNNSRKSRDGSVVNRRGQNEHFTPPRRGRR